MALNDNRNSAEELVQPAHHLDLVVPNDTPHHTTHCQLSSVQQPVGAVLIGATVDPHQALSGDALSMLWTVRAPLARVCAAARGAVPQGVCVFLFDFFVVREGMK